MSEPIFHALAVEARQELATARHEWQRAIGHFRHEGHSITRDPTQPVTHQEPVMPLADTAAALQTSHASALAELEDLLAKGHDVVDNHMTQIRAGIDDVAAVASIADAPIVVAAAAARHIPPDVLDGFTRSLTALAAAWPNPQDVPAEPQQEQPAA